MTAAHALVVLAVLSIAVIYAGAYLVCRTLLIPWARRAGPRAAARFGRAPERPAMRLVRESDGAD